MDMTWRNYATVDGAGWPAAIPKDEQQRLVEHVRTLLEARPLTLADIHMLTCKRDDSRSRFPVLCSFKTWDSIYYTLDRAARAAGTGQELYSIRDRRVAYSVATA
jgi:hypothetical protein